MQRIDVLWLVEHVSREMDVACAVKYLAKKHHGVDIHVRSMYHDAQRTMYLYNPAVVVHPFFYFLKGALATEDYVKTWPEATHFNLAWEQIFYPFHKQLKAPADPYTREHVLHHAWGPFYESFLVKHGVPPDHIFLNGHPAYQLYKEPYCRFFSSRTQLSKQYLLNADSRWVFIPENYRWAFIDEGKIERLTDQGAKREEMLAMRSFCQQSLDALIRWCQRAAKEGNIEIIFRPRPATMTLDMMKYIHGVVGKNAPHFHIIKNESVREWIEASDCVASSISTSLLEAAVAKKPPYIIEPVPIPPELYCQWYEHVPRLKTEMQFRRMCEGRSVQKATALSAWVNREMLSRGDPIRMLAEYIAGLVNSRSDNQSALSEGLSKILHAYQRARSTVFQKNYFNKLTHEMDVFSPADVAKKVSQWSKMLQ